MTFDANPRDKDNDNDSCASWRTPSSLNSIERRNVDTVATLTNALSEVREHAANLERGMDQAYSSERKNRIENSKLIKAINTEKNEKNVLVKQLEISSARVRELERGARRILELQSNGHEKDIMNSLCNGKDQEDDDCVSDIMGLEEDRIIDSLRKELADVKHEKMNSKSESKNKINELEKAHFLLKEEFEMTLHRKRNQIHLMKEAMLSQQQTINHMRGEMDQLQRSMEKVSRIRREELEEMQQEIMDTRAKTAQQEREMSSSKMKLEESKMKHKDDVAKLKDLITALEAESPLQRSIQTQRDDQRVEELNNTVQQLKWRNSNLIDDCRHLREKLAEMEGTQKTSKNDKWRRTALKEQIKTLTDRIHELEGRSHPLIDTPDPSVCSMQSSDSPRSVQSRRTYIVTPQGAPMNTPLWAETKQQYRRNM